MSDVRPMTDEEARMMRVIIDLRAQIQLLSDKALRFDLDAAGIELREKEAAELIELRAENERLRDENAICRDAIEHAVLLVEDWEAEHDDDIDAGAARATKRRLSEAIGKAVPRLLYEKPEGQRFYGLSWRELRAENERLARARAIVDEQAEDEGLWCPAATATEACLQQELRRLHAAVEGEG